MTGTMSEPLLDGVRALDLSQYLPGPYAAQILADMGAEVVKVEPPAGDPIRHQEWDEASQGLNPVYRAINAGKLVTKLNLKEENDRQQLYSMIAQADILMESYRPGVLDRLGFSREKLEELNPRLVHVALSGWGYGGPYSNRAGHDVNYLSIGGALHASGPEAAPLSAFPPVADLASGMMAAMAAISALYRVSRTGKGMFCDVSIMETVLAWQAYPLTKMAMGETPVRGRALLNGGAACYRVYECSDGGFMSVGSLETKFWEMQCHAMGRPDWIARQYADAMPQSDLIAEVAAVFKSQPRAHWESIFAKVDCCVEPVLTLEEMLEHPHLKERGQIKRDGQVVETLLGLRVDGAPPRPRNAVREMTAADIRAQWQSRQSEAPAA